MADQIQPQLPTPSGSYQMPSQVSQDLQENATQIVRVLTEHDGFLEVIKREMRGEQLFEDTEGNRSWVQVDKPTFVQLNKLNVPIRRYNEPTKRNEYTRYNN